MKLEFDDVGILVITKLGMPIVCHASVSRGNSVSDKFRYTYSLFKRNSVYYNGMRVVARARTAVSRAGGPRPCAAGADRRPGADPRASRLVEVLYLPRYV